jgi:pimeloyl-ACP methyl ester carboxylesterase
VNPHLASSPIVVGDAGAAVTAVLLHGRGSGPSSMVGLARALDAGGVRYVIPAAADGTWYPQRFTAPLEANEPWLGWALEAVDAAVETARRAAGETSSPGGDAPSGRGDAPSSPGGDAPSGRGDAPSSRAVVVAGFSQGACLALEYVARRPRRYRGVAALTGGLIGADEELTRPAGLDGTPVLLTTAEGDPWIPPERTRATAAILEAGGAAVDLRVFPPGPHTVRPDEVAALRDLLR